MKSIALLVGDITKVGGTERAVTNLANLLVHNYKVHIISIYKNENNNVHFKLDSQILLENLNFPEPKSITRYAVYLNLIIKLRKLNRIKCFDVFISTGHALSFILPLVVLFSKSKSVAAEHISRSSLPFISKLMQLTTYRLLDAVVVLSPSAKKSYYFCNRVYIIPNSLSFYVKDNTTSANKIILTVGRISYEKGYDRLVEVLSVIRLKINGWRMRIFGNGVLENEIKDLINEKELSDFISLNDFVVDIQKEYLNAGIYLMTSRSEAFPMVLLEAMSCGLPVIAYDCPDGPREIIQDGVNGFLVEDGNVNAMAERLLILISDDELRKTMGENAIRSVEAYKTESIYKKWTFLIDNLINDSNLHL